MIDIHDSSAAAERFSLTYRAAKAAMRAWAASPSDDLFQLALESFRNHEKAKAAFLAALDPKTKLTPPGVSQTHCIK